MIEKPAEGITGMREALKIQTEPNFACQAHLGQAFREFLRAR
jgi:hypothetical protein